MVTCFDGKLCACARPRCRRRTQQQRDRKTCYQHARVGMRISSNLDVVGLDDRPPLVDLGLVVGRAAPPASAWSRGGMVMAEIGDALLHRRIGERLDDRGVELVDDVLRHALRTPQPVPERECAYRRCRSPPWSARPAAAPSGPSTSPQTPSSCRRAHAPSVCEASAHIMSIWLPTQVLHRRRAAAVLHELEVRAGLLHEIEPADVRAGAGADAGGRGLAGVGLQPGDQLLERPWPAAPVRPTIISDDCRQLRDRLEIAARCARSPDRARRRRRGSTSCRR